MALSLSTLRSAYRGLPTSAAKQVGARAVKDALALGDRNPARVEELRARAEFHLPYAESAR